MKNNLQIQFDEIVNEIIVPILKSLKFKKKGNNFTRKINDISQVFIIQKSQWNNNESISFCINLGFFNDTIYKVAWNNETIITSLKEYDCFLSTRLGILTHGKDYWYQLHKDSCLNDLKQELKNDISNHAVPLFEKFDSLISLSEKVKNEPTNEPLEYVGKIYERIVFLMETNKSNEGIQLMIESYQNAFSPIPDNRNNYIEGLNYEAVAQKLVNQKLIDNIKRLADYYNIQV